MTRPNIDISDTDAWTRAVPAPSESERRAATRAVGTYAHTTEDCRMLLDMLGLEPQEGTRHDQ